MLQRAVSVIGIMLGLVVILVLGNTIRLAIENKKEEIIVIKLVGGTDGFVRRPFLYMGVLYGFGASLFAWLLLIIIIVILNQPVQALASSYQSNFSLSGLDFESTLLLFLIGTGLGWFSSWLAVRKHLDDRILYHRLIYIQLTCMELCQRLIVKVLSTTTLAD